MSLTPDQQLMPTQQAMLGLARELRQKIFASIGVLDRTELNADELLKETTNAAVLSAYTHPELNADATAAILSGNTLNLGPITLPAPPFDKARLVLHKLPSGRGIVLPRDMRTRLLVRDVAITVQLHPIIAIFYLTVLEDTPGWRQSDLRADINAAMLTVGNLQGLGLVNVKNVTLRFRLPQTPLPKRLQSRSLSYTGYVGDSRGNVFVFRSLEHPGDGNWFLEVMYLHLCVRLLYSSLANVRVKAKDVRIELENLLFNEKCKAVLMDAVNVYQ